MNFDAVTIERMVREVLSQTQGSANVRNHSVAATVEKQQAPLLTIPTVAGPKPEVVAAPAAVAIAAPAAVVNAEPTAVVIAERIVTADLIKERVKPGEKFVITKQAILTPSAQDYLRNYRITVERREASAAGGNLTSVRWKVLVSGVADHTVRAVDAVCQQRNHVHAEVAGNVTESVNAAISAICRAEVAGVVVITSQPDVVACRANRQSTIRAAVINDLAGWTRVQPQLKPNVVCLSPNGRSFMELQNLVNKVVTGPAPEVPTDW